MGYHGGPAREDSKEEPEVVAVEEDEDDWAFDPEQAVGQPESVQQGNSGSPEQAKAAAGGKGAVGKSKKKGRFPRWGRQKKQQEPAR